jgi:hypothetical protein
MYLDVDVGRGRDWRWPTWGGRQDRLGRLRLDHQRLAADGRWRPVLGRDAN